MKTKQIHCPAKRLRQTKRQQQGAMLVEVLISVLILAFGILGLVGLQARMTTNIIDSKYRAEAGFLADQLVGIMWSDAHGGIAGSGVNNLANYQLASTADNCSNAAALSTAVAPLTRWAYDADRLLPNARAKIAVGGDNLVTILLCWQAPNDGDWHKHAVSTQIRG